MVVWVLSFVSPSSWALSSSKSPNSPKPCMNMLGLVGWEAWKDCKSLGIKVKEVQSRPPLFILFYFQKFQAWGLKRNRFNPNPNLPHGKDSFFWNFHIYIYIYFFFHFNFGSSIYVGQFFYSIWMLKVHPSMNFELPYILHMVSDWSSFYIVGFASTKIKHMQACKKNWHKSWKKIRG